MEHRDLSEAGRHRRRMGYCSSEEGHDNMSQKEFWAVNKPAPEHIVDAAIKEHSPVAIYALFSGGDGSLHATHWAMKNIPGCEVAHINTGIGLNVTRKFVLETCNRFGWPLTEIKAKEDCGQDYDEIVQKHGFPGPGSHRFMYIQLKERCVEELVRRAKSKRGQRVMLLTGVKRDDSTRRSGYGGAEVTRRGGQVWVNHVYWVAKSDAYHYIEKNKIPRNPVSLELGMSGECGCGAYASPGELKMWERIEPEFAERIERLQIKCKKRGVHSNWETGPKSRLDKNTIDMFNSPMCVGCLKQSAEAGGL